MGIALALVQQTITSLVNSGSQIPKWILTEFKGGRQGILAFLFRSPASQFVKVDLVTEDPEQLKRAVQSLKISGGSYRGPYYEEKALEGERCHPKQMRGGVLLTAFSG